MLNLRLLPFCAVLFLASAVEAKPSADSKILPLQPRQKEASCATTVMKKYDRLSPLNRENYLIRQITHGNVPSFIRKLASVKINGRDRNGKMRNLVIDVTRDYLAVGCDSDYMRVPLRPVSAQTIADAMGFMLPTTGIVNAIYNAATVKLTPSPLPPSRKMMLASYIIKHNKNIEAKIKNVDLSNAVVAGDKKDIVLTPRMIYQPNRVAIYGWHNGLDKVIQPLSLVHSDDYLDYSHGVRLVSREALLDGKVVDLNDLLQDPNLTVLLQKEVKQVTQEALAYK